VSACPDAASTAVVTANCGPHGEPLLVYDKQQGQKQVYWSMTKTSAKKQGYWSMTSNKSKETGLLVYDKQQEQRNMVSAFLQGFKW
jgi:hypothetical protein